MSCGIQTCGGGGHVGFNGTRKAFGVVEISHVFIVVVTWLHAFVKTCATVHLEIFFTKCKLHLNKPGFFLKKKLKGKNNGNEKNIITDILLVEIKMAIHLKI